MEPPMSFDPAVAAALLHDARQRKAVLAALPIPPADLAEAAAVQRALAARLGQPAGFKIGATSARMQAYLGLDMPAAGFMPEPGVHASGAELRFDFFHRPGVECELVVRLAADLPAGPCSVGQAADAVGALMAGIEIVENHYGDLAALGTPTLVADQVFHAGAVIGASVADWQALDRRELMGSIAVDGAVRDQGHGRDLLGDPFAGLAWLAGSEVAAAFGGLKAGQLVMLGSVTPPVWLDAPGRITVSFPPLPAVELVLR
jgi:2-keto-4-pentenoate hydratase